MRIVHSEDKDRFSNAYAICSCLNYDEYIEVPRKKKDYYTRFICPRCGKEMRMVVPKISLDRKD